jgi:hypothetical protein
MPSTTIDRESSASVTYPLHGIKLDLDGRSVGEDLGDPVHDVIRVVAHPDDRIGAGSDGAGSDGAGSDGADEGGADEGADDAARAHGHARTMPRWRTISNPATSFVVQTIMR